MATSKQDRQGSRTVSDLESKTGQRFAKFLGLLDETRDHVDSVESGLKDEILKQSTSLRRDAERIVAEATKEMATNADVDKIYAQMEIMAGRVSIEAGNSDGVLATVFDKDGIWKSEFTQNGAVTSSIRFNFATRRFVFDGDIVVGQGLEDDITKITNETLETTTVVAKYLKLAGSININDRFIVDSSGNVTLPDNASISWTQVNNKPNNLATTDYVTSQGYQTSGQVESAITGKGYQTADQVTTITRNTVTTSYVNALKVKAGSVDAENITGTTITGKVLSGVTGDFSGTVTATYLKAVSGGNIAGWTIDDNSMMNGSLGAENSMWLCNTGTKTSASIGTGSGDGWCIAVGNQFGVKKTGVLYASNVDLSGKITAASGNIAGFTLGSDDNVTYMKSTKSGYGLGLYPAGIQLGNNGYTFFVVIYSNGGAQPVGGLTASGWKTI